MEKKQIKINGKIAVEIKINGGLFWKAGGPEPTEPNKLVYSTNAAGSTITVNGETVTLEQGENIVLDYPNEITSVKATNNTALTYIQIPNTVTSIEDGDYNTGSFYKCTALASVSLPDTMTMIGNYAFSGCDALGSVTLHEGIKNIGVGAFNNCTSLLSITIPESVTSINATNNTALMMIKLPNTMTSIDNNSFANCISLSFIIISDSITSINENAFYGCTTLNDFIYSGTKAQWASITKGTNWNKDAAFTVVHCTDGDVNI